MSSCCFTGHRTYKMGINKDGLERLKNRLKEVIEKNIENGTDTFYTGMAEGVDLMAAAIILDKKQEGADIRIIGVVPFKGQESRWSFEQQKEYNRILNLCDEVHILCEHYHSKCFFIRNEFMVDRSKRVIAIYNGDSGGTRYTVNYAIKKGVPVTCINPKNMEISEL